MTLKRLLSATALLIWVGCLLTAMLGCHCHKVVVEERPVCAPAPAPEPGPPPWAPAHGYRAKHRYHYYPASYVYFDVGRKVYFHFSGGQWRVSVSLPTEVRIDVGNYVVLEMDTDRPYTYHADVAKRYPPGQAKKLEGPKGKGKSK